MSERCTCARLCTAMHTHSGFARPYQRSRAAFSTVPVGNQIADSVRGISKCVESLIDSQINLICALLETVSQGCSGAVTRALIGISGAVLAA